jgi:serine protease Do
MRNLSMTSNLGLLQRRLAIFLIFSASFASPAIAQSDTAESPTETQAEKQSVATGFFISDGGYLITSHHVVSGYEHIYVVTADRRVLQASLIKVDQPQDLALLKVAAITPFLYLSHSQGVPPGMEVVTIGYPQVEILGLKPKITKGLVNSSSGLKDDPDSFQFSAEIQKGNSGGPLIGPGGTVVGVVKSKLDALKVSSINQDLPQNVNFAVKSSVLIKFLTGTPSIPFTRPLNAGVTINPIGIFSEYTSAIVPIIARHSPLPKKRTPDS